MIPYPTGAKLKCHRRGAMPHVPLVYYVNLNDMNSVYLINN